MKKYIQLLGIGMIIVLLAGCGWLRGSKVDMYRPLEDLHITDTIRYPDSPFDALVQETFSRKNKNNHFVHVLDVGDEALLARIHLIRSAQKAIYVQTFIWTNDETGRYFAYELLQAAQRGVKVKVIVDQWRGRNAPEFVAFLATAHPNLEIKNYNPPAKTIAPSALKLIGEIAFQFKQINQRMHNKIFVVDDRIAITGGRNYENDYYDRGATRNFKDRDVFVVGPVVRDMTKSFTQYWAFKLSVPIRDLIDVSNLINRKAYSRYQLNDKRSFLIGNLFYDLDHQASNPSYIRKKFIETAYAVDNIRFVSDLPGKNNSLGLAGGGIASQELTEFLSGAKEKLVIQTPYLVLDKLAIRGVKKLRKKSPDLDIMISSNSLAATDSIYAYSFFYKQQKLFIDKLRFRIFELKPVPQDAKLMNPRFDIQSVYAHKQAALLPAHGVAIEDTTLEEKKKHICIHAKSFVVDSKKVFIGSYNVDPRSAHLNTEVGLMIEDTRVAQTVENEILRDMAPRNSWTTAKRKKVLGISFIAGVLSSTLEYVPLVDIWPFLHTACFELKEGKEVVPWYHEDFYDNYRYVASFPGVSLSAKEIQIRLLKTFGGFATPII